AAVLVNGCAVHARISGDMGMATSPWMAAAELEMVGCFSSAIVMR
ncbi:hypothetical protein CBR_g76719, partial [Chara braunii]